MKLETSPEFAAFVAKYPRSRRNYQKRDAWKAWQQAMTRGITLEAIVLTLDERIHCEWIGRPAQFIPSMAHFLRAESFDGCDVELRESDPEPSREARAEAIRWSLEREAERWQEEKTKHRHDLNCAMSGCRFEKEPLIPELEEILARLK